MVLFNGERYGCLMMWCCLMERGLVLFNAERYGCLMERGLVLFNDMVLFNGSHSVTLALYVSLE